MAYEGMLAFIMGDHPTARALLSESASIHEEVGDRLDLARALRFLCYEIMESDPARARSLAEESVRIYRNQGGDKFDLAMTLGNLGILTQAQGDYAAARTHFEESVALSREMGDRWALALPLRGLGVLAIQQGDYEQAAVYVKESLVVQQDLKERYFISRSLDALAMVFSARGQYDRAARLFGAGEALREAVGAPIYVFNQENYNQGVAAARAGLGEDIFRSAWAEGRAMTPEQAIAYALAEPASSGVADKQ